MKPLHDETIFVGGIGLWLSGELPDQKEIEELFDLVKGCNRYMERTIKAIRKGRVSLDGFTSQDKEIFSKLFDSEKLNKELGRQLKEEIEKGMSKSNDKGIPKLSGMCDRFVRSHFFNKNGHFENNSYIVHCVNKNLKYMDKFSISAVPASGGKKSDACILAFDAEDLKPSYHGNVIILGCKRFAVDEANSSNNWREAFGCNDEPPQGALITVNLGYKADVITPYFEGKIWCGFLLAPFLIKNRK